MTVEEYINQFDNETQTRLLVLRDLVRNEAPGAVEGMSYGLIDYKLNKKPLVYFGAFPKHIGFYATPNGHEAFVREFASYKQGKGSVQFPHDQELPTELIRRVIRYRVEQLAPKREA